MTNRQARREQNRSSRQQRQTGRTSQRRPSGGGGGGSSSGGIFSLPFLVGGGILVIGLIAVLIIFGMMGGDEESDDELVSALNDAEANFPYDMANGSSVGDPEAPVVLTEYEDFQCPFCLSYSAQMEPTIVEEYVKSGKVRIEFEHFPILREDSVRAAQAAQCAEEQDKFWQYHHKLYLVQAEAGQVSDEKLNVGRFSEENLKGFAAELGLDTAAFDACLADQDTINTVQSQLEQARSFGFTGTPSYVINGVPLTQGNPSGIDAWRTLLDAAYEDATGGDGEATPGASETATGDSTPAASATSGQ